MTVRNDIVAALRAANCDAPVRTMVSLSQTTSSAVHKITTENGPAFICKHGDANRLLEEQKSLEALALTSTVNVATPLACWAERSTGVLVLPWIERGLVNDEAWRRFGTNLAALHRIDASAQYGFEINNHCGDTAQPNTWNDDWVSFNQTCRIGYQIQLADQRKLISGSDLQRLYTLNEQLGAVLPRTPKPSLLHGDLWSGNALCSIENDIVLIDPCSSFGDRWADIAMMKLFGGFPRICFDAYEEACGTDDRSDAALEVYTLYHVLNHVNLFGASYLVQAKQIVRSLGF